MQTWSAGDVVITDVIIVGCAASVCLVLLAVALVDRFFRRASLVLSVSYWLLVMTVLYAFTAVRTDAR